jgi:DNA-directed RNA polymerase beta subunit
MYLKHNSLGDDIPVVIVLKAMGLECDQEIVQFVGTEPELVDLFSDSLEEPYNLGVYSQEQVKICFPHYHLNQDFLVMFRPSTSLGCV